MNIFIIPSRYPSEDAHHSGIFTKEQAFALAKAFPDYNVGISLWGQKKESNLLWVKDHLMNLKKIFSFYLQKPSENQIFNNCIEFYTPQLTWTSSILEGNINNIINANMENLKRFEARFGRTNLIHAHVAYPAGYIALKLSKKLGVPYIITEHMGPFPMPIFQSKPQLMAKIRNGLQEAQRVISVSPRAATDIQRKTGLIPLCIPNLVDEIIFRPNDLPLPTSPFVFFTLCGIVPQKGIPDLLKAIAFMNHKDVVFRIGGEGEYRESYQQLAKELRVSHKIEWLGELSRTEAAEEFRNCHAFVLPSLHESMGVVYAEAIASGKPVIATRCGGPEFIVNQKNGLLVDVGAPEQLAKAMEKLINTYSQYQPEIIRKDFMERFSSKVVITKINSVYESVLQKSLSFPDKDQH